MHFAGNALRGQTLPDHATRRYLGQLYAGGFADKGHGAAGARIDFEHINHVLAVELLNGELHIHQTNHFETMRHFGGLAFQFGNGGVGQGIRRQRTRGVAAVHTGLLNMLHDATDKHLLAVANSVDIALDGVVQKAVQQHRGFVADFDRFAHVTLEVALLVHNFHGSPAQHITGTNHQRITEFFGLF